MSCTNWGREMDCILHSNGVQGPRHGWSIKDVDGHRGGEDMHEYVAYVSSKTAIIEY